MNKLIINADDFGWDEETTDATIECFENGGISSATIMTGRPGTSKACLFAKENSHKFSFGLHFNIVDGHKPAASYCNSLICDDTGLFPRSNKQRINALTGNLIDSEIQEEFLAQLKILNEFGVWPDHVDSHGHIHKFPRVMKALASVMKQVNINNVRRPQNLYINEAKISTKLINKYCSRNLFELNATDYFLTLTSHDNWMEQVVDILCRYKNSSFELAVHPGNSEKWRNNEKLPLLREKIQQELYAKNILLCNFSGIEA